MLRSKIYGVVPDFAILNRVPVVRGEVHMLGFIGVYGVAETLVDWNEASTGLFGRLVGGGGIVAR